MRTTEIRVTKWPGTDCGETFTRVVGEEPVLLAASPTPSSLQVRLENLGEHAIKMAGERRGVELSIARLEAGADWIGGAGRDVAGVGGDAIYAMIAD